MIDLVRRINLIIKTKCLNVDKINHMPKNALMDFNNFIQIILICQIVADDSHMAKLQLILSIIESIHYMLYPRQHYPLHQPLD